MRPLAFMLAERAAIAWLSGMAWRVWRCRLPESQRDLFDLLKATAVLELHLARGRAPTFCARPS